MSNNYFNINPEIKHMGQNDAFSHSKLQTAIEFKNVSLGYNINNYILKNINCKIYASEIIALVGGNGEGKSTFISSLTGGDIIISKDIYIFGKKLSESSTKIALLPQLSQPEKNFPINVFQTAALGTLKKGLFSSIKPLGIHNKRLVIKYLDLVNMSLHSKRLFCELSGGQMQRVLLARALVQNPDILILDEPFNGLDRYCRDILLKTLKLIKNEGKTIICAAHEKELIDIADRVFLFKNKQIEIS